MANKIITIDAGHGLYTAGKQTLASLGTVHKEWSLNDKVVRKVMSMLSEYEGIEVHRIDDATGKTDVALGTRVSKSNSLKANVHISVHQNAGGGTGTEVYWHTNGTAEDKKLASIVAPKLSAKTGLRNRGVKQAQFAVLGCKATAILIEGGFMDTATDYKVITSDSGQQAYAEAVVESLVEYLGLKKKVVSQPTQPTQPSTTTGTTVNFTVKIKVDSLNIRKSADFNSAVVGTVKKGEVYTIVEEKNGLGKLKSGAGWISMGTAYVEKMGATTTIATPTFKEYQVQITTALNVRKGAGTNYGLVTMVKRGEVYTIVEEKNGWGLLKAYKNTRDGWISLAYTKKK